MWLTLLSHTVVSARCPPFRLGGDELIVQDADWLWEVRKGVKDEIQFLYFFMKFLSNDERSGNIFVGSAISTAHFAQVCAQRAWGGILVLNHPFSLENENWRSVHSAIPNTLLDNTLPRLLLYLYDVMNLLIPPSEESYKFTGEMIVQNIKVSQTLSPLDRDIFIGHTKMRMDDIMDLVKFVEATATEDQKESFKSQLLRWRNTKDTAPIAFTMVRSPFIFGVACVKSSSTDVSTSGAFWGTITPRQS